MKSKAISYDTESGDGIEEEAKDQSNSEIEDCVIVDVEQFRFYLGGPYKSPTLRHVLC